jgi:hypothetical protein
MFILGLVSSANAGVINLTLSSGGNRTITAAIDDVITVDLKATITIAGIVDLDVTHDAAATLAVGTFNATKGGGLGENPGTLIGGDIVGIVASALVPNKFITGTDIIYSFSATVTGNNSVVIGLAMQAGDRVVNGITNYYYSPTGTQNSVTLGGLTIVPEPMTLVLLGLGGLFLRSRK